MLRVFGVGLSRQWALRPYIVRSWNSLDPHYLVPHYYKGHIPYVFGSKWVVGYQVVGVQGVPRIVRSFTSKLCFGGLWGSWDV